MSCAFLIFGKVALNIVSVKRHFGYGFQKTNKNSSAPVLNLNEDSQQQQNFQCMLLFYNCATGHALIKYLAQKLPAQPTVVQKEKDVKR